MPTPADASGAYCPGCGYDPCACALASLSAARAERPPDDDPAARARDLDAELAALRIEHVAWGAIIDATRRDRDEARAERDRLHDLVRHQRGPLHDAELITDDEYAALAGDTGARARLETYDEVRRGRDAAIARLNTAAVFHPEPLTILNPMPVRVERIAQHDGSTLWAVRRGGNVLGRDGEWEYEPLPSSRDDDFFARFRFATIDAAWSAACLAITGGSR